MTVGSERLGRRPITRRSFLKAGGGAIAGAYVLGLTGCGEEAGDQSTAIQLPIPRGDLPEGDVTFRHVDSGDTKAAFWEEFSGAYSEARSNVTFEYDALPIDRLEETVPLGIRNGSAHDTFMFTQSVTAPQAVREGWVSPLDDVIPNFEEWKGAFPPNTFFEGVHIFDGKTYVFTPGSPRRVGSLLMYNRELMESAGYDPSSEPLTWDEYRDAARKITRQGDEQTYGVVLEVGQPPRMEVWVRDLAHIAGRVNLTDIDPQNGEYAFASDEYLEAIELLMALKSDGSLFPGSASLLAPEAWPRVPQGAAGMVTAGPWVILAWEEDNPDFDFGVGSHPVPGNGDPMPLAYTPAGLANPYGVYSGSELKEVAGDILSYVGSLEGQRAWATITGGVGDPPLFPEAVDLAKENASPRGRRALELADELILGPAAQVRNPDTSQVYLELETLSPSFGEVAQSIFVEEAGDPRRAMQDLKDRAEANLDQAIEAARMNGAEVSREDWIFPNWNPRRDYTQEDYDAL